MLAEFSRVQETTPEPSLRVKSATLWLYVQFKSLGGSSNSFTSSPSQPKGRHQQHRHRFQQTAELQTNRRSPTLYVFRLLSQPYTNANLSLDKVNSIRFFFKFRVFLIYLFGLRRTGTSCWRRRGSRSSTADGWTSTSRRESKSGSALPLRRPVNCVCSSIVPAADQTSSPSCSRRLPPTDVTRRTSGRRDAGGGGGGWWKTSRKTTATMKMKSSLRTSRKGGNRRNNTVRSSSSTRTRWVRVASVAGLRSTAVRPLRPVANSVSSSVSARSDGTTGSSPLADTTPIIAAETAAADSTARPARPTLSSVTTRTSSTKSANPRPGPRLLLHCCRSSPPTSNKTRPVNYSGEWRNTTTSSSCTPVCSRVAPRRNSPACRSSTLGRTWTSSNAICPKWWSTSAAALDRLALYITLTFF